MIVAAGRVGQRRRGARARLYMKDAGRFAGEGEGNLGDPLAVEVGPVVVEGSRSTLYRGRLRGDSRHVVIKVLKSANDSHKLEREFAVGSPIDSPHVVRTFARVTVAGKPAIVLEDF